MSNGVVLEVEVRERTGKGGAREARREGMVPGVLYGGVRGPVAITIKENDLHRALRKGGFLSHMMEISHKGERQPVIARDIQFHPVTERPLHVDLFRVEEDTKINVEVSVQFVNRETAPGIKRGGVLNVVRNAIEVVCPAGSIPDHFTIDLAGLDIGDTVKISNVQLPAGVKPTIRDRDFTIATIAAPTVVGDSAASDEEGEEA